MRRSLGKMSKRTRLLGMSGRKVTPSELMRKFKLGQLVRIAPQSRYEGMPHPRYRGRIGAVSEIRGNAYVVGIKDGNMVKPLVVPGVHLKAKEKDEVAPKAAKAPKSAPKKASA